MSGARSWGSPAIRATGAWQAGQDEGKGADQHVLTASVRDVPHRCDQGVGVGRAGKDVGVTGGVLLADARVDDLDRRPCPAGELVRDSPRAACDPTRQPRDQTDHRGSGECAQAAARASAIEDLVDLDDHRYPFEARCERGRERARGDHHQLSPGGTEVRSQPPQVTDEAPALAQERPRRARKRERRVVELGHGREIIERRAGRAGAGHQHLELSELGQALEARPQRLRRAAGLRQVQDRDAAKRSHSSGYEVARRDPRRARRADMRSMNRSVENSPARAASAARSHLPVATRSTASRTALTSG